MPRIKRTGSNRGLDPWYQPFDMVSSNGSSLQVRDLFFPHSDQFGYAQISIKVPVQGQPNRCSMCAQIEGGASRIFTLWPGRHVLTVDLQDRPAGTQLGMWCVNGATFDPDKPERPFKIKSVRYGRSRPRQPISMQRQTPLSRVLRPGEQRVTNLDIAIQKFSDSRLSIDDSHNSADGSRISLRGCQTNSGEGTETFQTKALRDTRGSTQGACFLVASGPSVGEVDFNLLKDRALFGVNGSSALLRKFSMAFSHYMVVDNYFACRNFPLITEAIRSGSQCFFTRDVIAIICAIEPDLLNAGNIYLIKNELDKDTAAAGDPDLFSGDSGALFSKNLEKGFEPKGTVAFAALQACRYLGFQRVYTLGIDLFSSPDKYRFNDGEQEADSVKIFSRNLDNTLHFDILPAFQTLGDMLHEPGEKFEVFNLSTKSRVPSEYVPKMTLEEALKQESQ